MVEDHADSRELLALMLRHIGYEVIEAAAGREGIKMALAEDPDLIIMDLGLPDINGIEATVRLKQNPKTAQVPIIAYTGLQEYYGRNEANEAGIAGYLTKPTPPHVFKEIIERLVQRKCSE